MRWGFGWELGPFETAGRAIGVDGASRPAPPSNRWRSLRRRAGSRRPRHRADPATRAKERTPVVQEERRRQPHGPRRRRARGRVPLEDERDRRRHDPDAAGGRQGSRRRTSARWSSATMRANFSAGANLMLLLLEAQEGNWDDVDLMVRAFQGATMALKYADVPVVVAPAGMVLGGGCEIVLHGDRVQAAAETYIGLVEVGVGTDSGRRRNEGDAGARDGRRCAATAPICCRRRSACSRRSASRRCRRAAPDAARHGYLRPVDGVTMNRERLMADAKARALARAAEYVRPQPRTAIPVGGESVLAALKLGVHLAWRAGRISDHDAAHRPDARADPRGRRPRRCRHGHRAGVARSRARSVPEPVR